MRTFSKRLPALVLALLLTLGLSLPTLTARADEPQAALTVLFTHDTHDHFYPDAADVGGFTRLSTALKDARQRAQNPTITVDAGDFSMGSLFQTVYATDAPELRALGAMGYDVVTLGNHEFDYRPQGLADMLSAAKGSGDPLPALVQANYRTPKDSSAQVAVDAMDNFPVTDYTVIERDGVKIAVFGIMGVDSDECAPMSGMVLEPVAEAAKRVVAEIKEKENPTFIICLSHTGTETGKGEDYELAKAVDGIDLIISGHTHSTLTEPIEVNNTLIVSCGPYTRNLGSITITPDGGYTDYTLTPLDPSIPSDPDMEALAQRFKAEVDENYLSQFGLSYDQVITTATEDFSVAQTGNLIGHAYIETIQALEGEAYDPIAFAVAPSGVIRDVIRQGEVTTAQAFDILSLGSGADGSPGYPLVSVYLTGKDMRNVFEVDASVSLLMGAATLYGAGSWWHYNPNRMFLDRVTECQVFNNYGAQAGPFADDKLYRVVADLYSGQMLATVKDKSFGLLSITPRDQDGNPVTDFEEYILRDREGRELKAWQAFAAYLSTQEAVTPQDPGKIKRAIPSWNPLDLLIPMGMPTLVVLVVALLLIAMIVLIIYRIATRRKRKALKAALQAGWTPPPRKPRR